MVGKVNLGTSAENQNAGATPLKCPRCDSANTKFCYYNNYSLSQPRHFCKSCKRYWTRGGTLRNVPVGGGSRKNKRVKKHNRSAVSATSVPSLPQPQITQVAPTDFNSLFYGSPALNSANVFLPKFDPDAQFTSYEGNFQSCLGYSLADLQKSTAVTKTFHGDYSLFTSQIHSSSSTAEGFQSLLSYDELPAGVHENNTSQRSVQWQTIKDDPVEPVAASSASVAVADSSYFYWNQAVGGGWLESGSSMTPLI